ncbi:cytochrome c oxidase subunit II [Hydrogenivirga sp. 128-5-R1-1]|uniref:cytochrome c oxidase subunit II n=1 Tax=Hydrogenivirga sp. 128-5-R1-1 TaxID=392423 RepID=UPI00015F1628|nr:cytochrome c oxidase subunit II [Hydrogenivirga sp. 128-5-R1-1]EDP74739.1 Heme/copper-type cytochrome/quinol oxidase, subunit 2 [Hydrogenivirga sp. 128-5-R1-1]
MAILPPGEGWFHQKVAKDEKIWMVLAFIMSLFLFFWMIAWHVYAEQNPSFTTYRTTPEEFYSLTEAFINKYKVGEENGVPVVKPPPGSDVFLLGRQFRWEPVLILKKGEEYRFHISSLDVLHGFSIQPVNMNFMVFPKYDYVLTFKPTSAGEYAIVCNEFCGIGHHMMIGKIIVEE